MSESKEVQSEGGIPGSPIGVASSEMGKNSPGSKFHPAVNELIYEVQKLYELDLDQEVPDADLIEELEETFPKLPDLDTQKGKVKRLVSAAQLIAAHARNLETLDAKEMRIVQRALKPFDNDRILKRGKVVGTAFRVLKGMASGALNPGLGGPLTGIVSGLVGAIKQEGLDREKDGRMKQLMDVATKVESQAHVADEATQIELQQELKAALDEVRKDKLGTANLEPEAEGIDPIAIDPIAIGSVLETSPFPAENDTEGEVLESPPQDGESMDTSEDSDLEEVEEDDEILD